MAQGGGLQKFFRDMIRIRCLSDLATDVNLRQLAEVQKNFRKAFAFEAIFADRRAKLATDRSRREFEVIALRPSTCEALRNRNLYLVALTATLPIAFSDQGDAQVRPEPYNNARYPGAGYSPITCFRGARRRRCRQPARLSRRGGERGQLLKKTRATG